MADINVAPGLIQAPANLYQQILGNQNLQAATTGQQIANEHAGLQLQAYKGLLSMLKQQGQIAQQTSPQQQASEDQSGDEAPTLKGGDIDKGSISSQFDARLQQAQYIPSARIRMIQAASAAAGAPELGNAYQAAEKASFDQNMQARNIEANQWLQRAYNLQDAVKAGNGITQLRDMDPAAAASLEAKAKVNGWSDADLNAHVGQWADAVGSAVFRHTGREISDNNGTPFDKAAGRPVPGGSRGPLSTQQLTDLAKNLREPTDTTVNGAAAKLPRWQVDGYPSFQAAYAALSGSGAGPAQSSAAPQQAAAASPAATQAPPKSPTAPSSDIQHIDQGLVQGAQQAPQAMSQYGVPNRAFLDPSFKTNLPTTPPQGQNYTDAQNKERDLYVANKDNLEKEGSDATAANSRALQYFTAAKAIVDAPQARWWAGLPGNIQAELAKNGIDFNSADARFEAIKYLNNGALSGLKSTYGSKPAAFDVKVNLTETFPNIKEQGIGAVRNLVNENIRAAQYDLSSARRITPYLNSGGEPTKFSSWNEQYAPRFAAVNDQQFHEGGVYTDGQGRQARYQGGQFVPIATGQIQR